MPKPIKVIDLFAGPGGLGEGFSAYRANNSPCFRIALSIEKETSAHRTLELRAFFRQFSTSSVPESYYAFLRGELGRHPEEGLYQLPEIQAELDEAKREAQQITLGRDRPATVYRKIRESLDGEDCILIGGPPCQAYSLVGRSRNYGAKDKSYSAADDHRNFLYQEYLKIIVKFQPMIFVMENVKGMLSARVNGELIFTAIQSDLENPGKAVRVTPDSGGRSAQYRIYSFVPQTGSLELFSGDISSATARETDPKNYIIRSENYGVPQARHRVILLGIREDIADELGQLRLLNGTKKAPSVHDVICDLPALRSKLSKIKDSLPAWRKAIQGINRKTLSAISRDVHVPDKVDNLFTEYLMEIENSPETTGKNQGLKRRAYNKNLSGKLKNWFEDKRLGKFVTNHEARGHIVGDLHRYLYYSTYASVMKESPKSHNLPAALWPEHKNFGSGKFADRFRVQVAGKPGTTVTSHISKDGHYFIHYDPLQCRSLTVREAARIQTFPDNYFFVGNRTEQYVQVGNAVPPWLAYQLAGVVHSLLE